MKDLQDYFEEPLRDLGESDARFRGIAMPLAEIGVTQSGITEQFLGDAETYHTSYSNSPHWLGLFNRAFSEVAKPAGQGLHILDIGAGSGANTVVPCLELFPDCRIIATDLSAPLLRILRSYLVEKSLTDRIACVCTNAMRTRLKPAVFDIVVGGSILHHLVQPELALAAAYRALKPGGLAIFFEPFEGFSVLRVAFELILDRGEPLLPAVEKLLKAMILDWTVRAGTDKSAPVYEHLDDKWLFTKTYIERVRCEVGFSALTIVPLKQGNQYHAAVVGLLKLGAGLEETALPDWAWSIVDRFDLAFSTELKRDVPLECAVVFQK